jgi:hypothetical protein
MRHSKMQTQKARLAQMNSHIRRASVVALVCGGLAGLLTASASAAAAEAASVLPKGASKDSKSDSQSKAIDLDSIASIIADMAAEQTRIDPAAGQDDSKRPPSASRKLQLKGLGVKYQMNERTTIESGIRLGPPGNSGAEQFGAALPNHGSPGAFIKLQRQLGGR